MTAGLSGIAAAAGAELAVAVPWQVNLACLVACLFFILALRGLASPQTSRTGNRCGMAGMAIAIAATVYTHNAAGIPKILAALVIGGGIGIVIARRIAITALPQLIAASHALVGLAAVVVGVAAFLSPAALGLLDSATGEILPYCRIALGLSVAIGAAIFCGAVVTCRKPKGHMPVVLSMLNSGSGWAAAAMGFALQSLVMIATGALVGASGAFLALVMAKARNRS